ncbi:D-2-hydroxyacid dehydrogenase [Marinomonas sp. TW1]|uniref:D-2-hydroxyacid dehydrogenase n=1 Tax=Marinomonas sp. TW1 TaxID=1561203 RepID=UPI0007AF9DA6|nr:D-2-hydroxyacid dehydrogenase [Marinomonas sp. TW1]KZN13173.1 glycerate dehydrogenase [Marinomonas sp. TW1]
MKAVFLDRGSFPKNLSIRFNNSITSYVEYHNTHEAEVAERILDADIVLTNKVVISREQINNTPSLKLIQVMATGTNNVAMEACEQNGVKVQNVEGYSATSVPEHTFAMLLALRRNLMPYLQEVQSGAWDKSEFFCLMDHPIKDLSGSKMAIIGSGQLGQQVSILAKAFGMQVMFVERKNQTTIREGYVSFDQAVQEADIISLHCPLTSETTNLIGELEFKRMQNHALLINMSRGGIVNEEALVSAIESKQIAGAAFDVAAQEPMPNNSPLFHLTQYPNFLLTPHVAWASQGAMEKLVQIAINRIHAFVETKK